VKSRGAGSGCSDLVFQAPSYNNIDIIFHLSPMVTPTANARAPTYVRCIPRALPSWLLSGVTRLTPHGNPKYVFLIHSRFREDACPQHSRVGPPNIGDAIRTLWAEKIGVSQMPSGQNHAVLMGHPGGQSGRKCKSWATTMSRIGSEWVTVKAGWAWQLQ
jgi:hypothetical protein